MSIALARLPSDPAM